MTTTNASLWLPSGCLTVLRGDVCVGKSTLALDIASRVTAGRGMPDGTNLPHGAVLVMAPADDPVTWSSWRLQAAGADLEQVSFLLSHPCSEDDPFALPAGLGRLEACVRQEEAALVVMDVVADYRSPRSTGTTAGLRRLARRTGAAILLVEYFSRRQSRRVKVAQGHDGSLAVVGIRAAFADWAMVEHPRADGTIVLAKVTGERRMLQLRLVPLADQAGVHLGWKSA